MQFHKPKHWLKRKRFDDLVSAGSQAKSHQETLPCFPASMLCYLKSNIGNAMILLESIVLGGFQGQNFEVKGAVVSLPFLHLAT